MAGLWEDVKKSVKQGLTIAADKTEEYTKIGKVKLDVLNLKRDIEKTFKEIGMEVFDLLGQPKKANIGENAKVKELANKIVDLRKALELKEGEIEKIKDEARGKEAERKQNKGDSSGTGSSTKS
jgi:hypothetical protein